ncbi:DUF1905 domain-containing protein (plasmid) [Photobacterium sp. GJ3]|uniref:YdeI/OmpD-associated family protein n=1 Tax=Photobacterium sp. GJ3 TaxID=2829502 RepID=UPI001B8A9573|nr:YdeI/OmpD-associated family protein [Photobacterium sp. GJ3]QUJ69837.1 DUF1905 domain-containing protein [Photobacterium sp. GJ3]
MSIIERSEFMAKLLKPLKPAPDFEGFILIPKAVSEQLPRRGRTTVDLMIEGYGFRVTLEPDGNLSHWAKLSHNDLVSGHLTLGEEYSVQLIPVDEEPEPKVPDDLSEAIHRQSSALETWQQTTTIARLDWVHWVESAKQAKTRAKRVSDACNMLAEGKRRVCCFDHSGFYSKALKAPKV